MKLDWNMLKWGLVFGGIMALLQAINVLSSYQAPPDTWTVVRFVLLPSLGTVLTTVVQKCFPIEPPKGGTA